MRVAGAIAGVVLTALFGAALPAHAQGLTYGVKGGMTLANLSEDDEGDTTTLDSRIGLVAGGFVTWPLGGRLALQPEALFTQKGAKVEQGGGTLTQQLDYLDIPVLVAIGSPVATLGTSRCSAARRLASGCAPAAARRSAAPAIEDDVSDAVKSTDVRSSAESAITAAASLEGRYSWGVADIDKETSDDVHIRTRGISILAGWRF